MDHGTINAMQPVKLVTTQSDHDIAADLKTRLHAAMAPVLEILEEANAHRFNVMLPLERDAYGKLRVRFVLTKEF